MKTMTCKELGGACDAKFQGETFEQIVQQSQQHGKEMFEKQDKAHFKAMEEVQKKMQDRESMQKWVNERKQEFEALPEDP